MDERSISNFEGITLIKKTGQSAPGPFKKSNHSSLLISATVDAFRGHGFSLLVTEKHVLLRLLVAKILALASIFPVGSSAHAPVASLSVQKTSAIPAEVATCASIN
jgi:hypothetical protein